TAPGLGFQDTMPHVLILRRDRARFEIIVDDIEQAGIIATVHRPVMPVEYDVIDEIENAIPADRGVAARIVGPEIADEHAILAAHRRTEGMVPGIQRLGRDTILDSDIDGA